MKRWVLSVLVPALLGIGGAGCSDRGEEAGVPALSASTNTVTLNAGGTATVTITGGVPPYVITESPDSSLASAALQNAEGSPATLVLTAPVALAIGGTTRVGVGDSRADGTSTDAPLHDEELIITIVVSPVPSLVAVPSSVTVAQAQAVNVSISGGTPPYAIVEQPDAGLATAVLQNAATEPATLVITGVTVASAAGSTSVKVRDSSPAPAREVSVPVTKIP